MNARAPLFTVLLAVLAVACGRDATGPAPKIAAPATDVPPVPRLDDVDPDVVAAIESALAELRQAPDSGDAWGKLGNRYLLHDFLREAAQCFARAEELDPDRVVWTYRRALSLIDDDPAEAAKHFERSLRSLDDHAPAHENYARVLWRLGREDEAIAQFERACALDPRAPEPETGLGQIYLARGELEKAREHLETAVARDPRHTEAHVALAQVYLGLGDEKKARKHAEISRTLPQETSREDVYATPSLPPAGARARTRYGKQLERRGKLEEAEQEYRTAVGSNPDYYAARASLATLLARTGRRDEAIALLREGQERHPDLEQIRTDLARLVDSGVVPESSEGDE